MEEFNCEDVTFRDGGEDYIIEVRVDDKHVGFIDQSVLVDLAWEIRDDPSLLKRGKQIVVEEPTFHVLYLTGKFCKEFYKYAVEQTLL